MIGPFLGWTIHPAFSPSFLSSADFFSFRASPFSVLLLFFLFAFESKPLDGFFHIQISLESRLFKLNLCPLLPLFLSFSSYSSFPPSSSSSSFSPPSSSPLPLPLNHFKVLNKFQNALSKTTYVDKHVTQFKATFYLSKCTFFIEDQH